MQIYLKEKIGNPNLFTGRKEELDSLLKWVDNIKPEFSKSTAILSRRKTGNALMSETNVFNYDNRFDLGFARGQTQGLPLHSSSGVIIFSFIEKFQNL